MVHRFTIQCDKIYLHDELLFFIILYLTNGSHYANGT